MHKIFAVGAMNTPNSVKSLTLRSMLNPILDNDFSQAGIINANSSSSYRAAVSPDKTKTVLTNGSSNNPMNMLYKYIPASDDSEMFFSSMDTHPVSFSGAVMCCDTNNEYRAYGGGSPNLYVFRWIDNSLVSLVTTGLGTVNAIRFSPDGEYLALGHTVAPYLRIYKTSDWSFVNSPSLSYSCNGLDWLPDSSSLVTINNSHAANTLHVVSNTGVLLFSSKGSGFPDEFIEYPTCIRRIRNTKVFLIGGGSSNTERKLVKFNAETFLKEYFVDIPNNPNITIYSLEIDPVNMIVYLNHAVYFGRFMSKVNLIGVPVFESAGGHFEHVVNSNTTGFVVVTKNMGKVTGTVRDIGNLPAERIVLAYDRETGDLAGKTVSDASTGDYVLILPSARDHDIVFQTADGEQLNDLFFARVEPEPV